MDFTAFPGFSLDITEETYNIDPTVALYEKKFPFRAVCFVIRRFWLPVYVPASGHEGSNGVGDNRQQISKALILQVIFYLTALVPRLGIILKT
jgi:hypothetical protein